MEQCVHEQIKKAAGQLEEIFMQAVLLEQISMPKPHVVGNKTDETLEGNSEKWGRKGTAFPPSNKMMRPAADIAYVIISWIVLQSVMS